MFDVDKFLEEVYALCQVKNSKALDLILETLWDLVPNYDVLNEIDGKVDISRLSYSAVITFLTLTCRYDDKIPNHLILWNKFHEYLVAQGEPQERIVGLTTGLKSAGTYWEDMKMLGAPEWLSGPKPND